jgi:hypothetical protein
VGVERPRKADKRETAEVPADGRAARVLITEDGRRTLQSLAQSEAEALAALLSTVGEENLADPARSDPAAQRPRRRCHRAAGTNDGLTGPAICGRLLGATKLGGPPETLARRAADEITDVTDYLWPWGHRAARPGRQTSASCRTPAQMLWPASCRA